MLHAIEIVSGCCTTECRLQDQPHKNNVFLRFWSAIEQRSPQTRASYATFWEVGLRPPPNPRTSVQSHVAGGLRGMATAQLPTPTRRWARTPFYFNSAAHLLRIEREKATNLAEFLEALRTCSDASIFQHTFRTLQEHHFIREGFSNDFAHWAFAACNEVGLAERLAALDVREFTSIPALRERLLNIVETYLDRNPRARDRAALEPFYFCASDTVV